MAASDVLSHFRRVGSRWRSECAAAGSRGHVTQRDKTPGLSYVGDNYVDEGSIAIDVVLCDGRWGWTLDLLGLTPGLGVADKDVRTSGKGGKNAESPVGWTPTVWRWG
jgi:hypothetical protein